MPKMVSLKLLVLLLVYFVACVSAWKHPSSYLKPFRNLISQALLISSFSTLTNPMTSIAVEQPIVTNNKDLASSVPFAVKPVAHREHASRLDYDEETIQYYTTGWKKDIAYMKASDDSYKFKAEYRELRFYGFTLAGYGLVYRYSKFSSDEYNKQLRNEREQREAAAEKARADREAAAEKERADREAAAEKDRADMWNNTIRQEMARLVITLLFYAYFVWTPESIGYKVVAWVWKGIQGALHIQ